MEHQNWADFVTSGVAAPIGEVLHRPTGQHVPVMLVSSRAPSGDKLSDELCEIDLTENKVLCRVIVGLPDKYADRIRALLHVLLPYLQNAPLRGSCAASLGDEGLNDRVLSFCCSSPAFLIPDSDFINLRGYAKQRMSFAAAPPWEERLDTLYWRGTDTGVWRYSNREDAPRVAICRLAKAHPGLIDAAITRIELQPGMEVNRAYYLSRGYMGPVDDQDMILRHRYQIDIDGNTNAWAGLYLKLLSGSPVLKVTSEFGFRQWYYDALEPWENFVPVRSDLSDLAERLSWLRAHPAEAQRIGANGAALARSLTLASELPKAFRTVGRLLAMNEHAAA